VGALMSDDGEGASPQPAGEASEVTRALLEAAASAPSDTGVPCVARVFPGPGADCAWPRVTGRSDAALFLGRSFRVGWAPNGGMLAVPRALPGGAAAAAAPPHAVTLVRARLAAVPGTAAPALPAPPPPTASLLPLLRLAAARFERVHARVCRDGVLRLEGEDGWDAGEAGAGGMLEELDGGGDDDAAAAAASAAESDAGAGTVRLSAAQEGNSIIITIEDDGKGMDPERLRRKAVERA
jgi:hypothetical protein